MESRGTNNSEPSCSPSQQDEDDECNHNNNDRESIFSVVVERENDGVLSASQREEEATNLDCIQTTVMIPDEPDAVQSNYFSCLDASRSGTQRHKPGSNHTSHCFQQEEEAGTPQPPPDIIQSSLHLSPFAACCAGSGVVASSPLIKCLSSFDSMDAPPHVRTFVSSLHTPPFAALPASPEQPQQRQEEIPCAASPRSNVGSSRVSQNDVFLEYNDSDSDDDEAELTSLSGAVQGRVCAHPELELPTFSCRNSVEPTTPRHVSARPSRAARRQMLRHLLAERQENNAMMAESETDMARENRMTGWIHDWVRMYSSGFSHGIDGRGSLRDDSSQQQQQNGGEQTRNNRASLQFWGFFVPLGLVTPFVIVQVFVLVARYSSFRLCSESCHCTAIEWILYIATSGWFYYLPRAFFPPFLMLFAVSMRQSTRASAGSTDHRGAVSGEITSSILSGDSLPAVNTLICTDPRELMQDESSLNLAAVFNEDQHDGVEKQPPLQEHAQQQHRHHPAATAATQQTPDCGGEEVGVPMTTTHNNHDNNNDSNAGSADSTTGEKKAVGWAYVAQLLFPPDVSKVTNLHPISWDAPPSFHVLRQRAFWMLALMRYILLVTLDVTTISVGLPFFLCTIIQSAGIIVPLLVYSVRVSRRLLMPFVILDAMPAVLAAAFTVFGSSAYGVWSLIHFITWPLGMAVIERLFSISTAMSLPFTDLFEVRTVLATCYVSFYYIGVLSASLYAGFRDDRGRGTGLFLLVALFVELLTRALIVDQCVFRLYGISGIHAPSGRMFAWQSYRVTSTCVRNPAALLSIALLIPILEFQIWPRGHWRSSCNGRMAWNSYYARHDEGPRAEAPVFGATILTLALGALIMTILQVCSQGRQRWRMLAIIDVVLLIMAAWYMAAIVSACMASIPIWSGLHQDSI